MEAFGIKVSFTEKGKDYAGWNLDGDLSGKITLNDFLSFVKKAMISISREVVGQEQRKGKFDKNPRIRTDNKWDSPDVTVRPFGKIEHYGRQQFSKFITEAYDQILLRSPVETGTYKNHHYIFLNNNLIATNKEMLITWLARNPSIKDKDFIRIINVTPYASRLEVAGIKQGFRGKTKGIRIKSKKKRTSKSGMQYTVANGVYALAARSIRTKYKSAASFIKFEMMPNGHKGIKILPTGSFRTSYIADQTRRGKKRRFSGPYVYPSVVFEILQGGLVNE